MKTSRIFTIHFEKPISSDETDILYIVNLLFIMQKVI